MDNKKQKKTHKNSFLKKSENINQIKDKNFRINNILFTAYNTKNKKQNDYLRLYSPTSNFFNTKIKINSYSNDNKNIRNKINNNF